MKATGIVRRIDDLGRAGIPKEIRRTMRIWEGDPSQMTWSPDELFKKSSHKMPSTVSIGSNMKKMFANGEMDRDEFEKQSAQMGIKLTDK